MSRRFAMLVLAPALFVSTATAHAQSTQLEGTVTSANGQPVAGVSIVIGSYSVVTNGTGHYVLENLRPGNYTVTVIPRGKRLRSYSVPVSGSPTRRDFRIDW